MNDELYETAVELVRSSNDTTVKNLRSTLNVGYSRATKLIDAMEFHGVVTKARPNKGREVINTL